MTSIEGYLDQAESHPSAAVAAQLALQIQDPAKVRIEPPTENKPALLIRQPNVEVCSLEGFQPRPHRPEIRVSLDSARHLHAYVVAQAVLPPVGDNVGGVCTSPVDYDSPAIFACRDTQSIMAFIDYHHPASPRWLSHSASVKYQHSHQFQAWMAKNNKPFTQEEFVLFIDEMLQDFRNPNGAAMLSFASALDASTDQTFKSSVVTATGETSLIFTDKRKGDVETKLIDSFEIAIPIWQGSEVPVLITGKLFHRLVDVKDGAGNLTGTKALRFWYTLRNIERIIDKLFQEEVAFLQTAFQGIAPVYAGTAPTVPTTRSIQL